MLGPEERKLAHGTVLGKDNCKPQDLWDSWGGGTNERGPRGSKIVPANTWGSLVPGFELKSCPVTFQWPFDVYRCL